MLSLKVNAAIIESGVQASAGFCAGDTIIEPAKNESDNSGIHKRITASHKRIADGAGGAKSLKSVVLYANVLSRNVCSGGHPAGQQLNFSQKTRVGCGVDAAPGGMASPHFSPGGVGF